MKLKNRKYNLEISEIGVEDIDDETLIFDSTHREIEVTLIFKITIIYKDKTKKDLKISAFMFCKKIFIEHEHFILLDDLLILWFGAYVVGVSLERCELIWKIDRKGGDILNLHEYQDDYIVEENSTVFRITKGGQIVWEYLGMFDTILGGNEVFPFELKTDVIEFRNNLGMLYKLGYNGEVLEEPELIWNIETKNKKKHIISRIYNYFKYHFL